MFPAERDGRRPGSPSRKHKHVHLKSMQAGSVNFFIGSRLSSGILEMYFLLWSIICEGLFNLSVKSTRRIHALANQNEDTFIRPTEGSSRKEPKTPEPLDA